MKAKSLWTGFILVLLTWPAWSQEPGLRPPVEFVLLGGQASAVPQKAGIADANGGVINVAQPNPTTVVVTMTGLAAANADPFMTSLANYHFTLAQDFDLVFNSKGVKSAKVTLEGRVIGLLRTNFTNKASCWNRNKAYGTAETQPACATVTNGPDQVVTLTLPGRVAGGCEDLSVYNHEGPVVVPVRPGKFTLHETWGFGATHSAFHIRGASAEFAPQPNYGPETTSFNEFRPFNGLATRDFGYQLTMKVVPEF